MIRTVDYHTAGEPFRIVVEGTETPPGDTVLDRRESAMRGPLDESRALLCNEPRGHADMYGGFLVPPDDDGADLGVLFWHKDGFSTACGHGTIALATYAVEHGIVAAPDEGEATVTIDVPSGRVRAIVETRGGTVVAARFVNVPAYELARGVPVQTALGSTTADLSYGGAVYASVDATSLGLSITPEHLGDLIAVGRAIKWALNDSPAAQHPSDPRLSGVYGTIWYEHVGTTADGIHQRNCTVFADGEVDRSPCGSGTSARLTLLTGEGLLPHGQVLTHQSVIGSTFHGRVLETVDAEGRAAHLTEVRGSAHRTGEHRFVLDPADPLGLGFQLR